MALLLSVVPAPYRWLAVALLAAALAAFGWVKGASHVQAKWDAEKQAIIVKTITTQAKQAEATVKVVTKYVDRVKVIHDQAKTIIKEVPVYVTQESDARCIVPRGFVLLHDSAATNTVPPPPGPPDAAPAGLALSAVATTVTENYATCHETAAQLTALQDWIREMEKR